MSSSVKSPSTAQEQLTFGNTVEGTLLKTIGRDMTPALRAELKQAGLDLDRPLLPGYPAATFHKWLGIAARHLYPKEHLQDAAFKFGERTLAGLSETLMGKAMKATLGLLGVKRGMQRATRAFRSNDNYTEVTAKDLGPTSMELEFNEVHGMPTFYQGVIHGASEAMGGKSVKVEIASTNGHATRYVVTWKE